MTDETKLPDAGMIENGPAYMKNWKPDMSCCRSSVPARAGYGYSQCSRKVKVERDVLHHGKPTRYGYCSQHDPIAVAEKNAARKAKWDAEWKAGKEKREAAERERKLRDDALEAIRKIAAGHNDPRGLALEVLSSDA